MHYKRWQGPERPVANGSVVTRLELESSIDAPGLARAALEPLRAKLEDDVMERAVLLISELVTNAVRYGEGPDLRVRLWRTGTAVAVIVLDDGPGIDAMAIGTRRNGHDGAGGLGLPLVDLLSEAWGSGTGRESWVWFQVSPRTIPAFS